MKVLALIVSPVLLLSLAVHAEDTTTAATPEQQNQTTKSEDNVQERMFNEKTKIPAFFTAACRDGKDSIIEHLLNTYPDYARHLNTRQPSGGESCLHHAARNGHASLVEIMVHNGGDPNLKTASSSNNEYGAPPLFHAISNGHYTTVKILVRNGADVNQVFEYPQEEGNTISKKVTCYDVLMDMIDRIGDKEVAIASGDEDYYRMKEQLEDKGAKRYVQLVNNDEQRVEEQQDVHLEL